MCYTVPVDSSIGMYDNVFVEYQNCEHRTITAAQSSKPSTCRSEYVLKEVWTYMHAASGLFSWSKELLALASGLFAPKKLDHLYLSFQSILRERAQRAEPPDTRSTLCPCMPCTNTNNENQTHPGNVPNYFEVTINSSLGAGTIPIDSCKLVHG